VNESGRVEAFSDGVFAVAITLLVLGIKTPTGPGLWHRITSGSTVDSFAAYAVSFLVIGIMWANHHQVFGFVARVDRVLLFLNLVLLLVVVALPWATDVVAQYLARPGDASVALAVYGGFMVAHALTFAVLWWWLTRTGHLFDARVDVVAARRTRVRFALGGLAYPLLVGLAFVSAPLTLLLHGALAVYYGFNQLKVPLPEEPEPAPAIPPPGRLAEGLLPRRVAEGPVGEDGAL
jgi:uncharacterized membrane protein